jgi:hypothetical protein
LAQLCTCSFCSIGPWSFTGWIKKPKFGQFFMSFRPEIFFHKWPYRGNFMQWIDCAHFQCLKTLPRSWIRESECVYWSENRNFLDFLGVNLCGKSIIGSLLKRKFSGQKTWQIAQIPVFYTPCKKARIRT